jgi:hypothetical protein
MTKGIFLLSAYFICFANLTELSKYISECIQLSLNSFTNFKFSFIVSFHKLINNTSETVFLLNFNLFNSFSTDNSLDRPILPQTPGKLFFEK